MTSLLSSKPGTAYEAQRAEPVETGMDDAPRTPAAPGPLASFARFVLCGGGVGLVSSPAVALLAALMPWAVANALITVASTLLCTELHARFTFGAGRRAGWRQHWQSAGSASAAYAVTCAAMFILQMVQPSAGMLREQAVYLSAAGLAGIGRFLVLRLFVFAGGRNRTTAPANSAARVQAVRGMAGSTSPGRSNAPTIGILCGPRAATASTAVPTVRASSRCWTVRRPCSSGSPVRSPICLSRNRRHRFPAETRRGQPRHTLGTGARRSDSMARQLRCGREPFGDAGIVNDASRLIARAERTGLRQAEGRTSTRASA